MKSIYQAIGIAALFLLLAWLAWAVPFPEKEEDFSQINLYDPTNGTVTSIRRETYQNPTFETLTIAGEPATFTLSRTNEGQPGPQFIGLHETTTPAVGDDTVDLIGQSRNDAAELINYLEFHAHIVDPTDGSEDSEIHYHRMEDGTLIKAFDLDPTGAIFMTELDAAVGMDLILDHDSASPAVDDENRIISRGEDDGGGEVDYAEIAFPIVDPANASEDGSIVLRHRVADSMTDRITFSGETTTLENTATASVVRTDNGAVGPILELFLDSASPLADDTSSIVFQGNDDGAGTDNLAEIRVLSDILTAGSETGKFQIWVEDAGTMTKKMDIDVDAGLITLGEPLNVPGASTFASAVVNAGLNINAEASSANLTVQNDGSGNSLTSEGDTGNLTIADPDSGAAGPTFTIYQNSASAVADDEVGTVSFQGNDDAGTPASNVYAKIVGVVEDPTAGAEDGGLEFWVDIADTLTEVFTIGPGGDAAFISDLVVDVDTLVVDATADEVRINGAADIAAPLHVNAETGNTGVRYTSTDANITIELKDSTTSNNRAIVRNGDNMFLVPDGGNLKIGTTASAPTTALHVDSAAANTTAIATIENTAGDYQIFRVDANPNGSITGSVGDLANDTTGGVIYYKQSGSATDTGWVVVAGIPVYKSYTFASRSAASGEYFQAGFYDYPAADTTLLLPGTPTQTHGEANVPYAAHVFVVASGPATGAADLALTVSGTTIDDDGLRLTGQTVTIITDADADPTLDEYFETSQKWLGTVTFTLTGSDPGTFTFNYGFAKYEDFGNRDFILTDFETVGLANADDSGIDIEVIHHNTDNWTYSAGAFQAGGDEITGNVLIGMVDRHVTESDIDAGEQFAFKRSGMSTLVDGDDGEGVVVRFTTGTNNSVSYADTHIGVLLR